MGFFYYSKLYFLRFYYLKPYFIIHFIRFLAKHFYFSFISNLINNLAINKAKFQDINIVVAFLNDFCQNYWLSFRNTWLLRIAPK